jgi:hypothetical protein
MRCHRPQIPEAYSLEYIENFRAKPQGISLLDRRGWGRGELCLEHEEIGWCVLYVPFLWLNQTHKKRR